jgi:mercuric ion transport protein
MTLNRKNSNRGGIATLTAAVVTAAASSLCCIGPLIYLLFGVSAAGLSGIEKLGWLQIPMLIISTSLIVFGFWRLYFSRRPFCSARVSRSQMLVLYWLCVPIILFLQLYPFILPWVYEVFE